MLKELKIKNFVLVDELHLNFSDKLTILSGETGAGKSVIAGAIHIVLGEQFKGDVFFDKSKNVEIAATFNIDKLINDSRFNYILDEFGIDSEIEEFSINKASLTNVQTEINQKRLSNTLRKELFFFRELKPDGRSSIFINGRKSTNAIVKEFKNVLLDFHSQRDQQTLFNEDTQLYYLDSYAEILPERDVFFEVYTKWQEANKNLQKYIEEIKQKEDKILLYKYQIEELEAVNLKIDEETELDSEYNILSNAKEILDYVNEMKIELFESDKTVFDILGYYKTRLQNYTSNSKVIENIVEYLSVSISNLHDLSTNTKYIEDDIYIDEQRLEAVELRLKTIYDLKTKYKRDVPQLIDYLKDMQNFINNYSKNVEEEITLKKEISLLQIRAFETACNLHKKRTEFSLMLSQNIIEALKKIAIPDAHFKIHVEQLVDTDFRNVSSESYHSNNLLKKCVEKYPEIEKYTSTGFDRVKYLFSANKGTCLQELKTTISGGELSRLLLVIKSLLANKISERTIVFDEIDIGIGGKTATMLGDFIKELSQSHQIVCISHLAQIAAIADKHVKIEKINQTDRSIISLKELNNLERVEEIARMLSGNVTSTALEHASELLNGFQLESDKQE